MDDMFDTKDIDKLDKQISDRMNRPTLVGKMKAKNAARDPHALNWSNEWRKYWYVYVFLIVSAVFTMTLGFYMGVSPTHDILTNTVTYQTDIPHLLLAFVFACAFVTVTEIAFAIGKWLFFTREERNTAQKATSILMMFVAGVSILGTGIAGGLVIASNISFLTSFVEIPASAQKWVVIAIPVLIAIYAFLLTVYSLSSESAASERLLREQRRESELDNQTRLTSIEQVATEQLQVEELRYYMRLVSEGKISATTAKAAIRAGRTLGQEEIRQGRDIDGVGGIGNNRPMTVNASESELVRLREENARLRQQTPKAPADK